MGASRDYLGVGTASYLDFGDTTIMDGATTYSQSCWFQADSIGNNTGVMISKGAFAAGSFYTYFATSGATVRQFMMLRSTVAVSLYRSVSATSSFYNTTTWQHCTVTWTTGPTWKLYANGVSQSVELNTAGNPASIQNSATSLDCGGFGGTTSVMDGRMAYNSLYTAVLSQAMVDELMWNPYTIFNSAVFLSPGINPSATNEVDIIGGLSGTPSNAAENFDGPPIGIYAACACC